MSDENIYDKILRLTSQYLPGTFTKLSNKNVKIQTAHDYTYDDDPDEDDSECVCPPLGPKPPNSPPDTEMDRLDNLSEQASELMQQYSDALAQFSEDFGAASQSQARIQNAPPVPNPQPVLNASQQFQVAAAAKRAFLSCMCTYRTIMRQLQAIQREMQTIMRAMDNIAQQNVAAMNNAGIPILPPQQGSPAPGLDAANACLASGCNSSETLLDPNDTNCESQACQSFVNLGGSLMSLVDANLGGLNRSYKRWLVQFNKLKEKQIDFLTLKATLPDCQRAAMLAANDAMSGFSISVLADDEWNVPEEPSPTQQTADLNAALASVNAAIAAYNAEVDAWNSAKNAAIASIQAVADAYNGVNNGLPPTAIVQEVYVTSSYDHTCADNSILSCEQWIPSQGRTSPTKGSTLTAPVIADLPHWGSPPTYEDPQCSV